MEIEKMDMMHNRFQTLKEAIKYLEDQKFECVVYPHSWISADWQVNAEIISDAVTYRHSVEMY
jgi:hypothetical protein